MQWALRLRVPGWAGESPVPTDLYTFTETASAKPSFKINGKSVTPMHGNGYATFNRVWKPGDKVEVEFPMDIRRIRAHENAEDDRGKLAIERGPVVYCLEGIDQADTTVFNKYIPADAKLATSFEPGLLGGVQTITGTATQVDLDGNETQVPFKAIPYSTWNNRGNHQMAVWIPEKKRPPAPPPLPHYRLRGHHTHDSGTHTEGCSGIGIGGNLRMGRERPVGTKIERRQLQAIPLLVAQAGHRGEVWPMHSPNR